MIERLRARNEWIVLPDAFLAYACWAPLVMDGARVVEVGSHEDLMTRGGPYSELYGIQASAYS